LRRILRFNLTFKKYSLSIDKSFLQQLKKRAENHFVLIRFDIILIYFFLFIFFHLRF